MQLGVTLHHIDHLLGDRYRSIIDLAVAAEAAGLDQVVLTDHVALADDVSAYPASIAFPYPPDEPYPDPLVTLAAIGARTERIRLSTGVLIAPLRPAVLLAKMAATVDALSGGRLDLGVGTGWLAAEFDALGVPMDGKARRMEEYIAACQTLWQDRPASFSASTVEFDKLYCSPAPANGRSIPVWFGGGANLATARRIATYGDGWLPVGVPPADELRRGIELLRAACDERDRDPATLGVRVMLPAKSTVDETMADLPALAGAGVTAASVPLGRLATTPDEVESALGRIRELGSATA